MSGVWPPLVAIFQRCGVPQATRTRIKRGGISHSTLESAFLRQQTGTKHGDFLLDTPSVE
jgi:hypothetical protein